MYVKIVFHFIEINLSFRHADEYCSECCVATYILMTCKLFTRIKLTTILSQWKFHAFADVLASPRNILYLSIAIFDPVLFLLFFFYKLNALFCRHYLLNDSGTQSSEPDSRDISKTNHRIGMVKHTTVVEVFGRTSFFTQSKFSYFLDCNYF